MASRRAVAKAGAPPTHTNVKSKALAEVDSSALGGSPFLPTPLELVILGIYPATLIIGSFYGAVSPSTRIATYSETSQSYLPDEAPGYFARKDNILNLYFVKVGWLWVTGAFLALLVSLPALGPPFKPQLTTRRIKALIRYTCITLVWIFITQWFFGPAIIDRSFHWTGGKCDVVLGQTPADHALREEMSSAEEAFTRVACKAIGGQWKGGHDISGHVFLLILGSAMLWLEMLPSVHKVGGMMETRRVLTAQGQIRSVNSEAGSTADSEAVANIRDHFGIGGKATLAVLATSWWMLLMTGAYFHTWLEKTTGLLVALTAIYLVYFLPRGVPSLRAIVGLPGA